MRDLLPTEREEQLFCTPPCLRVQYALLLETNQRLNQSSSKQVVYGLYSQVSHPSVQPRPPTNGLLPPSEHPVAIGYVDLAQEKDYHARLVSHRE